MIIGVVIEILVLIIIVAVILTLVIWFRIIRSKKRNATKAVNMPLYDYVAPPDPPPRNLPTNMNVAYASHIQTRQNTAYVAVST